MQNYSVMNTQTLNKMSWEFYRGDGSYSRLAAGGAKVKQASKVALNAALHSDLVEHAGRLAGRRIPSRACPSCTEETKVMQCTDGERAAPEGKDKRCSICALFTPDRSSIRQ